MKTHHVSSALLLCLLMGILPAKGEPAALPRLSAPVVYKDLMLIISTKDGIAAVAFGMGAAIRQRAIALTLMMVLFTFAARQALVVFDPYLSSRPFAEALLRAPKGEVIFDNQYYTFSSVFFYANTRGWLLNGRVNNLEYGSYAPGAPQVFLDDAEFAERWRRPEFHYLLVEGPSVPRIEGLVGKAAMHVVKISGGKFLFANRLVQ